MDEHFDCHKVMGLTEVCGGRLFRLRGNAACCNTAAESRRESALVDAKISGCPFRLLTALFQIMKYSQGSQAEASMSSWIHLEKLQALPCRQNSEKELAGFYRTALYFSFVCSWSSRLLPNFRAKIYTLLRQSADNLHLRQAGMWVDALLIGP
jgi:hypothetical protein